MTPTWFLVLLLFNENGITTQVHPMPTQAACEAVAVEITRGYQAVRKNEGIQASKIAYSRCTAG